MEWAIYILENINKPPPWWGGGEWKNGKVGEINKKLAVIKGKSEKVGEKIWFPEKGGRETKWFSAKIYTPELYWNGRKNWLYLINCFVLAGAYVYYKKYCT